MTLSYASEADQLIQVFHFNCLLSTKTIRSTDWLKYPFLKKSSITRGVISNWTKRKFLFFLPLKIVSGMAKMMDSNQIDTTIVFNLFEGSLAWLENGVTIILYRSALRANRENTETPSDKLIMKFSKRQ